MIYIKEDVNEKLKNWSDDTIHILADFDRTISDCNSSSSWSILSKKDLMPTEYAEERNVFYNHYRPIEKDENLDPDTKNKIMTEWWGKHIGLFVKYKLPESVIKSAARDLEVMLFRDGAKEFLEDMHKRKIPVIIISSGIGNFVEQFLIKNKCNFNNIYIVSNFIKFENGIAVGVADNIIHSLNKNEAAIPPEVKKLIENRPNIILLGDKIEDTRMATDDAREQALKIGFLEDKLEENLRYYMENFDVVCTDNTPFNELLESVKI